NRFSFIVDAAHFIQTPDVNELSGVERPRVKRDHQVRAAGDYFRPTPLFGKKFVGFIKAGRSDGFGIVDHRIPSSNNVLESALSYKALASLLCGLRRSTAGLGARPGLSGSLDRVDDLDIARTAAQISRNRLLDLVACRMRICVEQRTSGDEHAGSAY